jgi:poly(A) polymerase
VAALVFPTVASRYPLVPGANLELAHEAISGPVEALTGRYHISAHIRHLARELILSCYRIARGKAYRTKGKFVRKPEFREAWAFVSAWARVAGGLDEVVGYWDAYLRGPPKGQGAREGRRRRRPRRRRPPEPPTGSA